MPLVGSSLLVTKTPMNNIDPVWQSEEDEEPVEVTVKKPVPEANSEGAVVSRRPAAIVGMLIVIGIGIMVSSF